MGRMIVLLRMGVCDVRTFLSEFTAAVITTQAIRRRCRRDQKRFLRVFGTKRLWMVTVTADSGTMHNLLGKKNLRACGVCPNILPLLYWYRCSFIDW